MERKEEQLEEVNPEDVPDFANEQEEAEFWSTHTLSEEFWDRAEQNHHRDLTPSAGNAARTDCS